MQNLNFRSKYWVFTEHDTSKYLSTFKSWKTREGKTVTATYGIVGRETCPTSGKQHYQGYIEYDEVTSLGALIKALPGTHWEPRFGTAEQASEYCKKEGNWGEFGTMSKPRQGKRNDVDQIRSMALSGIPMSEIVQHANSFQAIRMAEKIREYHDLKRNWKPYVSWFYGPTGTGKTRTAFEEADGNAWISSGSLRWWQGYDGHENVIIDDFRGDHCPLHVLLQILDRYPFNVEFKGGSKSLLARKIWITCPYSPEDVYRNHADDRQEDIRQLLRRIDVVREFKNTANHSDQAWQAEESDAGTPNGVPEGSCPGVSPTGSSDDLTH